MFPPSLFFPLFHHNQPTTILQGNRSLQSPEKVATKPRNSLAFDEVKASSEKDIEVIEVIGLQMSSHTWDFFKQGQLKIVNFRAR